MNAKSKRKPAAKKRAAAKRPHRAKATSGKDVKDWRKSKDVTYVLKALFRPYHDM
jgi:hypothetical protein